MTTTYDAFLGGKFSVFQPKNGFRSGLDAVLLAASIPAQPHQSTLELGCGVGVASLCLHSRVPNLTMSGVELQDSYANLCVQNAEIARCNLTVASCDLRSLPTSIRTQQFDHIFANPPYYKRSAGPSAQDQGRNIALSGDTPLDDWVRTAAKRLAPKGSFTMIQHITRLPEVLASFQYYLGSIKLKLIQPDKLSTPHLFIVQAHHSGKAPFEMRPILTLHDEQRNHTQANYTDHVNDVLRHGAALHF